jgi:hypothetical protein
MLLPTAAAAAPCVQFLQMGEQQNDIGTMQIPTSSALAGNSYLYLNVSNNWIKGGIPDGMGNLEMFRSPANSTDPYDLYVFNRGGPDRTLDLTNNALYGEFPMFLINQAPDLPDSCLCNTEFNVTAGNNIFCPTKATLGDKKFSKQQLQRLEESQYTCLVPGANGAVSPVSVQCSIARLFGFACCCKLRTLPTLCLQHCKLKLPAIALRHWLPTKPHSAQHLMLTSPVLSSVLQVSLASYLGKPANWLSTLPAESTLPEKAPRARQVVTSAAAPDGSSSSGGKLGGGAIAGIIIAVLAGLAILGSLAYFVGYKKLYQVHKATSFKRGVLPDGPAFEGAAAPGPYPAAAYGAGAAAGGSGAVSPDIEMPPPRSTGL